MKTRWRMLLTIALTLAVCVQAVGLAGQVRPGALHLGAWLGLAGAALVLVWGLVAIGLARRRLLHERSGSGPISPAADDTVIRLLVSAGDDNESAVVLGQDRDPETGARYVPGVERRAASDQAAEILRQIEDLSLSTPARARTRTPPPRGHFWRRAWQRISDARPK